VYVRLHERAAVTALAVIAVAASALFLSNTQATAAPRDPLGNEGRWIIDTQGRVVVLHGVNMVTKHPPYFAKGLGFGRDDAEFLRSHGFNTVRLGVIYTAVEPQPGRYDDRYLDQIAREARLLARHGIHVLLDFHQDMYNGAFQGGGFPDWAVKDDGLPREPKAGFPLNYWLMPALQHAYDNFWANSPGPGGVGLQDRFAAAWRHVAKRLGKLKRLVGYDIMNEPSPGSSINECSTWTGCPGFDRGPLSSFNERVYRAIRKADRRHLVWHEPHGGFGFGNPSFTEGTGGKRSGFSFHLYCIGIPGFAGGESRPCERVNADIFGDAEAASRRTGDALLLTEFGANVRWPDSVAEAVTLADEFMIGWQHWAYTTDTHVPGSGPPGPGGILVDDARKPLRGANVAHETLQLLVRPYPQAVAGTPRRWEFDPATHRFELVYKTRPVGDELRARARTEVVVPRLQYPDGYRADVEGGRITSPKNARLLKIAAARHAKTVKLKLAPR
jgi:endoglycosylceramidase